MRFGDLDREDIDSNCRFQPVLAYSFWRDMTGAA